MKRLVLMLVALVVLNGCDITDSDTSTGTETFESSVLTFEPVEPINESPSTTGSQSGGDVTIPSGSSGSSGSSSVSGEESDSEDNGSLSEVDSSTGNSGQVIVSASGTTEDFVNEGGGIDRSFWACTTPDASRSFRYRFSTNRFATTPDNTLRTMRAAEDSVGERVEVGGNSEFYPSFQSWLFDSVDTIELSPKGALYDPENYSWTLDRFNTARTRVVVQDSRGFSLACARIMETSNCSFEYYYPDCSLPAEDPDNGQGDVPITVLWEFASTEKFVNSSNPDTATNYWACDRGAGLESFRMKVGGTGRKGRVRILEGTTGDERREDLDWRTDTVGNVNFLSNYTQQEIVLWTLFDFNFADDAQTFSASDTKGFELTCQRKSESPEFSRWDAETSCFNVPERCDDV